MPKTPRRKAESPTTAPTRAFDTVPVIPRRPVLRWAHNVPGRLVYDGPRGLWGVAREPAEYGAQLAIDLVAELNARVQKLEIALGMCADEMKRAASSGWTGADDYHEAIKAADATLGVVEEDTP